MIDQFEQSDNKPRLPCPATIMEPAAAAMCVPQEIVDAIIDHISLSEVARDIQVAALQPA
jgi:hypothetical protein